MTTNTLPTGKLKHNEVMRPCRHTFSQEELAALGPEAGEARRQLSVVEAEFDSLKKDYKVRIESRESRLDQMLMKLRDGFEMRETLCFWAYDTPVAGTKSLHRADTMEVVETAKMDEADRQLVMEAIDDLAAAAGSPERLALMDKAPWPKSWEEMAAELNVGEGEDWLADLTAQVFNCADDLADVLADEAQAAANLAELLDDSMPDAELRQWRDWAALNGYVPGMDWLAVKLAAAVQALKIEADAKKAADAAKKKDARKGRKAGGAGTVDVEADEGTRDDHGPDSKEDL
jgi:hypothetical protein